MWAALQKGEQSKTAERAFDGLRCDRLELRMFQLHWSGLQLRYPNLAAPQRFDQTRRQHAGTGRSRERSVSSETAARHPSSDPV
jgi:hypothetical protein